MIISMFDKSLLQKKLCYYGDKNEPHLRIRNAKEGVSTYLPMNMGWVYDEPNKERGELVKLEWQFEQLRQLNAMSPEAIFHPEMYGACDEPEFLVALTQFRRALVLGIDPTNHNLHKLREYICDGPDGVDDLMDMKPYEAPKRAVAEYDAVIDGHKISGEMTE